MSRIAGMKGMEPLVATIALIVIVVVAAAITVNWQNWFLPSYQQQITDSSLSELQCSRAGLALDNIVYDCNNNCAAGVAHTLSSNISNTGDVSLSIRSIILQNNAGEIFEFKINTTLGLDSTYSYANVSLSDCSFLENSVLRVSIVTACTQSLSYNGSVITWVNC